MLVRSAASAAAVGCVTGEVSESTFPGVVAAGVVAAGFVVVV
jgi:hypothetical protein